jgi:hypothetical protein
MSNSDNEANKRTRISEQRLAPTMSFCFVDKNDNVSHLLDNLTGLLKEQMQIAPEVELWAGWVVVSDEMRIGLFNIDTSEEIHFEGDDMDSQGFRNVEVPQVYQLTNGDFVVVPYFDYEYHVYNCEGTIIRSFIKGKERSADMFYELQNGNIVITFYSGTYECNIETGESSKYADINDVTQLQDGRIIAFYGQKFLICDSSFQKLSSFQNKNITRVQDWVETKPGVLMYRNNSIISSINVDTKEWLQVAKMSSKIQSFTKLRSGTVVVATENEVHLLTNGKLELVLSEGLGTNVKELSPNLLGFVRRAGDYNQDLIFWTYDVVKGELDEEGELPSGFQDFLVYEFNTEE